MTQSFQITPNSLPLSTPKHITVLSPSSSSSTQVVNFAKLSSFVYVLFSSPLASHSPHLTLLSQLLLSALSPFCGLFLSFPKRRARHQPFSPRCTSSPSLSSHTLRSHSISLSLSLNSARRRGQSEAENNFQGDRIEIILKFSPESPSYAISQLVGHAIQKFTRALTILTHAHTRKNT